VKAFIGKLGVRVRKLEEKSLDMFSRIKDFVEKNNLEISDTAIVPSIKNRFVNLQSRFSKYFPAAIYDKYKWFFDKFHADSPPKLRLFSPEKESYIDIYMTVLQKFSLLGSHT
jgi:hypothetical protein